MTGNVRIMKVKLCGIKSQFTLLKSQLRCKVAIAKNNLTEII